VNHSLHRHHRGYTLVEVLVTLVLVAIVLPVAMEGVSLAAGMAGEARRQSEAATLARQKLDELIVTDTWRSGQLQGDFGLEWPDFQWHAFEAAWEVSELRLLTVEVAWSSRGRPRSLQVSTLVPAEES
jgi:prepilin-type N-terminal cleavage/methylation domain-containing protein